MGRKRDADTLKVHEEIHLNALDAPNCDHIRITGPDGDTMYVRRGGRRGSDYSGATVHSFAEPGEYTLQYFGWQGVEVAAPRTITVKK